MTTELTMLAWSVVLGLVQIVLATVLAVQDQGLPWAMSPRDNPGRPPTLLLWRLLRPAVVIGRFQRADWEVDAAACAERGARVWRRFTGGGAVYLDPSTLCVALAAPPEHPWAQLGVPEMYAPLR